MYRQSVCTSLRVCECVCVEFSISIHERQAFQQAKIHCMHVYRNTCRCHCRCCCTYNSTCALARYCLSKMKKKKNKQKYNVVYHKNFWAQVSLAHRLTLFPSLSSVSVPVPVSLFLAHSHCVHKAEKTVIHFFSFQSSYSKNLTVDFELCSGKCLMCACACVRVSMFAEENKNMV